MTERIALVLAALVLSAAPVIRGAEFERIDGIPSELTWHLRVAAAKTRPTAIVMFWNYADSTDNVRAEIEVSPLSQADERLGAEVSYKVSRADSMISGGGIMTDFAATADGALSCVLSLGPAGTVLELGAKTAVVAIPVPWDRTTQQTLGYDTDGKVLRNSLRTSVVPAAEFAPYGSVGELMEHIESSSDPMERVWEYLDRNTDPALARPGGSYRLATIADLAGGYMIVYLGGAVYGKELWRELQVKGHLSPTTFDGHFRLSWLDSGMRPVDRETSADITTGGQILELNFPLLGSSMRFSAQP